MSKLLVARILGLRQHASLMKLTGIGIWSGELRRHGDEAEVTDAAAELDELGYSALWVPGGAPDGIFNRLSAFLRATQRATVASGILSVWAHDPQVVAAERAQLYDAYDGRFLLGLGISHAALVNSDDDPARYKRPLTTMRAYLDSLEAAAPPVPHEDMVLAALGPRMLALARDRTSGAHPYLVTAEHTRGARQILGDDKLLAPELGVVLESDPDRARTIARAHLEHYLLLPNYANNLRRLGFGDGDFERGGSDRLVDALIAWGDEEDIERGVRAHTDAGADHVCLQVLTDGDALPREQWRLLASALT
jgi:probable F420-dependent oxidoreductase